MISVNVTVSEELLERVDEEGKEQERGRSFIIRKALEIYLELIKIEKRKDNKN